MTDDASRYSSMRASDRGLRDRLIHLPRKSKQLLMLCTDAAGFFGCLVLCGWVQLIDPVFRTDGLLLTVSALAVTHLMASYLGFYHSIVRYLGMGLLMAGARVAMGSSIVLAALAWNAGLTAHPARLAVVYAAFCGLYLVGSRYMAQYYLVRHASDKASVVIYGAGEAGARVAKAMQGNNRFHPVAFVDDDPAMQGKRIDGLMVHPGDALGALIGKHGVASVLLALPSVSRRRRQEIISGLEELAVHVQTVPDFDDLISGKARVDDIREVDVEDLLSRAPVSPEDTLMQATLLGNSVMVTGAGGSIGSELCRQILKVGPKTLVLYELSEVALYEIDREMRLLSNRLGIDCEIVPLLGSVTNGSRVRQAMQTFDVHTVYHAAAYKHVPLVEHNTVEGVSNNVLGTFRTAKAAIQARVNTFVLVSTDKAVSPTSVMGASKRMAELVLQAFQDTTDITRFAMVRFGNVLESSGSVVPLFREQIKAGGPVTVTHPEIIRYFMTIPEAAQLVIQAGGMARGGEVFVLDMGEPVKIRELARRMIRLMGLSVRDDDNPNGDIEIQYTGLRPAEKLYEELLIGENVAGTAHPRIMQAREAYLPSDILNPLLRELQSAASDIDCRRIRDVLIRAVREYRPTNGIEDLLWRETAVEWEEDDPKVVNFHPGAARKKRAGMAQA
jgi:FlaA1/EpsC-like NDP-sugar epimerase